MECVRRKSYANPSKRRDSTPWLSPYQNDKTTIARCLWVRALTAAQVSGRTFSGAPPAPRYPRFGDLRAGPRQSTPHVATLAPRSPPPAGGRPVCYWEISLRYDVRLKFAQKKWGTGLLPQKIHGRSQLLRDAANGLNYEVGHDLVGLGEQVAAIPEERRIGGVGQLRGRDGRWLLYSYIADISSDLMMVDHFR